VDTPTLGDLDIRDVPDVVVERWLRQMHRVDGAPLANATRAKIRNLRRLQQPSQFLAFAPWRNSRNGFFPVPNHS